MQTNRPSLTIASSTTVMQLNSSVQFCAARRAELSEILTNYDESRDGPLFRSLTRALANVDRFSTQLATNVMSFYCHSCIRTLEEFVPSQKERTSNIVDIGNRQRNEMLAMINQIAIKVESIKLTHQSSEKAASDDDGDGLESSEESTRRIAVANSMNKMEQTAVELAETLTEISTGTAAWDGQGSRRNLLIAAGNTVTEIQILNSSSVVWQQGEYLTLPSSSNHHASQQQNESTWGAIIQLPSEALMMRNFTEQEWAIMTSFKDVGKHLIPRPIERINKETKNLTLNQRIVASKRVISVSTSGQRAWRDKVVNFGKPVIILFTLTQNDNFTNPECVFWDTETMDWSSNGVRLFEFNGTHAQCHAWHLTSFAVLMDVNGVDHGHLHRIVLSLITYTGCALSILCFAVAIFAFSTFLRKSGNNRERTVIHINLCVSLLVAELLFVVGIPQVNFPLACKLIAGGLHYFFLAAFAWMFLEGYHLRAMLIQVFEAKRSRLPYYFAFGYGLPLIIVVISIGIDRGDSYGTEQYCWLSTENHFMYTFVGPVAFVLLCNFIFLLIASGILCRHMFCTSSPTTILTGAGKRTNWDHHGRSNHDFGRETIENIGKLLQAALMLALILGLTWTFGLIYVATGSIVFSYVFTVFNALQGLFILIFYVIFNEKDFVECHRHYTQYQHFKLSSSSSGVRQTTVGSPTSDESRWKYSEGYSEWDRKLPNMIYLGGSRSSNSQAGLRKSSVMASSYCPLHGDKTTIPEDPNDNRTKIYLLSTNTGPQKSTNQKRPCMRRLPFGRNTKPRTSSPSSSFIQSLSTTSSVPPNLNSHLPSKSNYDEVCPSFERNSSSSGIQSSAGKYQNQEEDSSIDESETPNPHCSAIAAANIHSSSTVYAHSSFTANVNSSCTASNVPHEDVDCAAATESDASSVTNAADLHPNDHEQPINDDTNSRRSTIRTIQPRLAAEGGSEVNRTVVISRSNQRTPLHCRRPKLDSYFDDTPNESNLAPSNSSTSTLPLPCTHPHRLPTASHDSASSDTSFKSDQWPGHSPAVNRGIPGDHWYRSRPITAVANSCNDNWKDHQVNNKTPSAIDIDNKVPAGMIERVGTTQAQHGERTSFPDESGGIDFSSTQTDSLKLPSHQTMTQIVANLIPPRGNTADQPSKQPLPTIVSSVTTTDNKAFKRSSGPSMNPNNLKPIPKPRMRRKP